MQINSVIHLEKALSKDTFSGKELTSLKFFFWSSDTHDELNFEKQITSL